MMCFKSAAERVGLSGSWLPHRSSSTGRCCRLNPSLPFVPLALVLPLPTQTALAGWLAGWVHWLGLPVTLADLCPATLALPRPLALLTSPDTVPFIIRNVLHLKNLLLSLALARSLLNVGPDL